LRVGETAEDFLRRADAKLLEAKAEGRSKMAVDATDRLASEVGA
jgi:PleD family two-component response regulator